jgi:hypothetical protein
MSLDLLLELQRSHAFDASPLRHDLGVYHVPFHELAPGRSPEDLLAGAARRGERIAVVGRSGSGKSSLIEHVLGPGAEGVAPIAVPVFGEPAEVVTSLQAIGGLIIQTLVVTADVRDAERRAALESASGTRSLRGPRRMSALSLGAGWMGAELRAEVKRQVPPNLELPRTAQSTLEVVDQLLTAIQASDLMPVLVFDDTDRWFRKIGGTVDHHDLAVAFFGSILPDLRQRPAGLVVAVHSNYLDERDLTDLVRVTVEDRIDVPSLTSAEALGKVIHSRVVAHTNPDEPHGAPPLSDVLDAHALGRLYELYSSEFSGGLRDLIRTVHVALTEACNGRFETITPELIDAAAW